MGGLKSAEANIPLDQERRSHKSWERIRAWERLPQTIDGDSLRIYLRRLRKYFPNLSREVGVLHMAVWVHPGPTDPTYEENPMKKSLLSIATASMLLAGMGVVSAQTTTTTTTEWTTDQGKTFTEYSTTKKYSSFMDPKLKPAIGMELPSGVTLYPLPDTMKVPSADRYEYGMVNGHPVVVETTTRKVVHTWD
jgi:hypothetical protein